MTHVNRKRETKSSKLRILLMEMKNDYYIYFHVCRTTGRTFYIGKGRRSRAQTKLGRSAKWHDYVFENGYDVYIYKHGMTEDEAYALEVKLINVHKEHGFLVNIAGVEKPMYGSRDEQEQAKLQRLNQKTFERLSKMSKVKKIMTLEEFEAKYKYLIDLGAVYVYRSPLIPDFVEIIIDRFVPPGEGEQYGTFLCEHKELRPAQADARKMGFVCYGTGSYIKPSKNEN